VHDTYENNSNVPFEEEQKNCVMNTMVQNILVPNQINDYFKNMIIVALSENFEPLWLFSRYS